MKNKNTKIIFVVLLMFLFCISIGYAVLNKTFTITGNSEVKQNTWDIHFENIQIKNGSVDSIVEPTIDNSKLNINFDVSLALPGDFYQFTFEVVNDGTIGAMVDSIVKTPELTEEQKKYINYIIEYQNGETIQAKQLLDAGEFVRIKVRVEYRADIDEYDLPTTTTNLTLGFIINYIQSDNTGIEVLNNGIKAEPFADGSVDDVGTIVTIESEKFYTIGTEGDNVKLLSMYNLYVASECASTSSCVSYDDNATGMQDSNMRGFLNGQDTRKGVTVFSSGTMHGLKYNSYTGSVIEEYVNNYKAKLEEIGLEIVEARLITKDELTHENIGCVEAEWSCSNAPNFIHSTSYWTGTAVEKESHYIWNITNGGVLAYGDYNFAVSFGVRPVLVIPKSLF